MTINTETKLEKCSERESLKYLALNGLSYRTPLPKAEGFVCMRKQKDFRNQRWGPVLRIHHFPDPTRQIHICLHTQDMHEFKSEKSKSSEKEGSGHRVPLLTEMKGQLQAGEEKFSPMERQ